MDAITVGIIVFFLAFLAYDTLRPARAYPKVEGWVRKGIISFVVYAALSAGLPFVWDAWLGKHRLIDATGLGTVAGAAVGAEMGSVPVAAGVAVALLLAVALWRRLRR